MDALALLCTLHADGPTTLRRLRDAGCGSLEDLGHVTADRLAELLGVTPAAGRRFLREANSLAERLGRQGLEPEDPSAQGGASGGAAELPSHAEPTIADAKSPIRETLTPSPASSRGLDRTDRQVLERVIDRWREAEQREAAASAPRAAESRPADPNELRISPSERPARELAADAPALDTPAIEAPALAPEPGALTPGALDGLDARSCERLTAAGCETLRELAEASALDLARAAKLPFTLVRRLQFTATRALGATPPARAPEAARPTADHAPSFAAATGSEPAADGPAGPFA